MAKNRTAPKAATKPTTGAVVDASFTPAVWDVAHLPTEHQGTALAQLRNGMDPAAISQVVEKVAAAVGHKLGS